MSGGAVNENILKAWENLRQAQTIKARTDFSALALFAPKVTTDARGRAEVPVKLPDNLTRYRVMVVAATEKDFGSAEANVTARLPLMVRPSAPRFLNFGDRFQFPVVASRVPMAMAPFASTLKHTSRGGDA